MSSANTPLQAAAKELQNQRVFYFHPQRGWDLGTVNAVSVSDGRSGAQQLVVTLRSAEDDHLVDVIYKNGLISKATSAMDEALRVPPDNLLLLPELHNAILVYALKLRHSKDVVYTGLGELVVALNPFKYSIPWYQDSCVVSYLAHLDRAELPPDVKPHVWSVAHRAFVDMRRVGANHSIIISGESGSGKTESCKSMIRYLCAISEQRAARHQAALRAIHRINERVQLSNVIMESFGNAKTLRNDNSSRFGKFTEVQFNEAGVLIGMRTTPFLLERSRIVHCAVDERVFHCFYQLAAGGPKALLQRLQIRSARDFDLLTQGKCVSLKSSGVDDAADFVRLTAALTGLGFTQQEQDTIWGLVASVAHLVNVRFVDPHAAFGSAVGGGGGRIGSSNGEAQIDTGSLDTVLFVAKDLLELPEPGKLAEALVSTSTVVKGEVVVRRLSTQRAMDQRDAVCKLIYTKLFQWIIDRINQSTSSEADLFPAEGGTMTPAEVGPEGGDAGGAHDDDDAALMDRNPKTWIALLDIFGFEDFPVNSFEQLCINLANEALQRHYTRHHFIRDAEEMKQEGISTQQVKFFDNMPCVELLQGAKNSVVSVLDDCSVLDMDRPSNPSASTPDATFLSKLTNIHRPDYQSAGGVKAGKSVLERTGPTASADAHPLEKPSDFFFRGRLDQDSFTIKHYAGDVKYRVEGFVEKNMDVVRDSSMSVLMSTTSNTIREVLEMDDNIGLLADVARSASSPMRSASPGSPRGGFSGGGGNRRTVASSFRNSLKTLMQTLDDTQPHWVRCIRPHTRKSPNLFDGKLVLEQLVAAGVLATIEQRQRNFPFRMLHAEFVERFGVLARSALRRMGPRSTNAERCSAILVHTQSGSPRGALTPDSTPTKMVLTDADAQVGRSRVFVSASMIQRLEVARSEVLDQNVVVMSMFLRCFIARKQACYIIWTIHAVRCQHFARRTLRIRRCVKAYYAELCQRIAERHVQQQRDVLHSEGKIRPRVMVEEQSGFVELARSFRVQLVPMIATVLKNIRLVETDRREGILQELQKGYWMLEATFAEGVQLAHERRHARLKLEHQRRADARQRMWELCDQGRRAVMSREADERHQLQGTLGPSLVECHRNVLRMLQEQERRDAEIQRLLRLRDEEIRRLQREEMRRRAQEEELWKRNIGETAFHRDVTAWRHIEAMGPGSQSEARDSFMQTFYASRLPSRLLCAGESGRVGGMSDVACSLRRAYQDDLRRRQLHQHVQPDVGRFLANELLKVNVPTTQTACIAFPPVRDGPPSSPMHFRSPVAQKNSRRADDGGEDDHLSSSDEEGALLAALARPSRR